MSKTELKRKFVDKLELFYRNFGNEWTLDDLVENQSQREYLAKYLEQLADKGIITLKNDGKSFTIIDLPSNHKDLFVNE
jgi:hypothetical protein